MAQGRRWEGSHELVVGLSGGKGLEEVVPGEFSSLSSVRSWELGKKKEIRKVLKSPSKSLKPQLMSLDILVTLELLCWGEGGLELNFLDTLIPLNCGLRSEHILALRVVLDCLNHCLYIWKIFNFLKFIFNVGQTW